MVKAFKYIKLLLPAILVATLVVDAVSVYKFPDLSKYDGPAVQQAQAKTKKPNLKIKDRKKKEEKEPEGTAGELGAIEESDSYVDGKYTGSAKGFGGLITVQVTIKGGRITAVKIISAPGEDAPYLAKAKRLTGLMVKKNSTNVDAVSGATYSSNGIIKAVRNALKKARKKGAGGKDEDSKQETNPPKREQKKELPNIPVAVKNGDWKDGAYTGTGEGFGGNLQIIVSIKDGKIVNLSMGKHEEDEEYYSKARAKIFPAIINKQSTGVDTVSGATYSSVGIIQAVTDALSKAQNKQSGKQPEKKPEEQGGTPDGSSDSAEEQDDPVDVTRVAKVLCDEDEDFEDYDLTMTFVIQGGKIIDIKDVKQVIDAKINDSYIKAATRGIKRQLASKPDFKGIDTISGATCTSITIIDEALSVLKSTR